MGVSGSAIRESFIGLTLIGEESPQLVSCPENQGFLQYLPYPVPKTLDIDTAESLGIVPIHPILPDPLEKLLQIIAVGPQSLRGIVLPPQGSHEEFDAVSGGHIEHKLTILSPTSPAKPANRQGKYWL
jgi:hypothetical protein